MTQILHVHGFIHPPGDTAFDSPDVARPSGVKVTTYEGELAEVATRIAGGINHPMRTHTLRTLDGWLREVTLFVDVNGTEMWHVITEASEPWPLWQGPLTMRGLRQ